MKWAQQSFFLKIWFVLHGLENKKPCRTLVDIARPIRFLIFIEITFNSSWLQRTLDVSGYTNMSILCCGNPYSEESRWEKLAKLLVAHLFPEVSAHWYNHSWQTWPRFTLVNVSIRVSFNDIKTCFIATLGSILDSHSENLASFSLQDGATEWHYFLVWTTPHHLASATDPPPTT